MCATDLKSTPYWWDRTPRPDLPKLELPEAVDVAIVGSGYTGLNAALETSRAGRSTLVFDAGDAGFGCSSRNGGQVSTSIKPSLSELTRKYGAQVAKGVMREGERSLSWIGEFVDRENIDCDFKVPGRFHAAHSSKAFEALARQVRNQPAEFEVPYQVIERADQATEIGTEAYHGGVVFENHASLDPARFHKGLLQRTTEAGAQISAFCKVTAIEETATGFALNTGQGRIKARDVIVATNGYTGGLTPWQQRRVIPIGSYMIATEALEPDLMDKLMPKDRVVSDSRKVVYYYRPSPDRTRILFGGRVSAGETRTSISAGRLKADLDRLFPELSQVGVSHSWMGFVAYTFDSLANCGKQDGIYYAMGYCGSGVAMASYLGMRIGKQVLGLKEGDTAFNAVPMSTRPLYRGKPWFLPATVAWYRFTDRLNLWRLF